MTFQTLVLRFMIFMINDTLYQGKAKSTGDNLIKDINSYIKQQDKQIEMLKHHRLERITPNETKKS